MVPWLFSFTECPDCFVVVVAIAAYSIAVATFVAALREKLKSQNASLSHSFNVLLSITFSLTSSSSLTISFCGHFFLKHHLVSYSPLYFCFPAFSSSILFLISLELQSPPTSLCDILLFRQYHIPRMLREEQTNTFIPHEKRQSSFLLPFVTETRLDLNCSLSHLISGTQVEIIRFH